MTTTDPSAGGAAATKVADSGAALLAPPVGERRTKGWLEAYALPMAWVVIIIVFSFVKPETFAQWSNVSSILSSNAVLVVVTLALIIPLTTGDFDLSVASVAGLSAVTLAHLNVNLHWNIGIAIVMALLVGLLVGLINGALIVVLGIESLIVTLGMSTIVTGITSLTDNKKIGKTLGKSLGLFYVLTILSLLIGLAAVPAGLMFSTAFYVSLLFTYRACFGEEPPPRERAAIDAA